MASYVVENLSELNQLFRDISLKFSSTESEDVVQSLKKVYGQPFKSLGNQDLPSCLDRLHEFGYVSSSNLTLLDDFVASKSSNKHEIYKRIEDFKASRSPQIKTKMELRGRSGDVKKTIEILKSKQNAVVNLYGSAGVWKTTLARNICDKWAGKNYVFDLREAKDMRAVFFNIMGTLNLSVPVGFLAMNYVVGKIHEHIENESKSQSILFLLDNVEQLIEGQEDKGKELREQFIQFLKELSVFQGKEGTLNILLTSRCQFKDSETVTDYNLQPLEKSFSENLLLPTSVLRKNANVNAWQREKLLSICKGVPLILKGIAAILRQRRKSPNDLISVTEMTPQRKVQASFKTSPTEKSEEEPFDFEGQGIDKSQMSVIREMFNSLPSDSLRVSAVSVSLFHGPFSPSTAAKILGISIPEAIARLEGLVACEIIQHVVDVKQLMYDIHPLLRKYAESVKHEAEFCESYSDAQRRFHEHFMSKMTKIAGFIESNYVKAFNDFASDRPNYEFAIDISLLPEYFSVPDGYQENALIASLLTAMLPTAKRLQLFKSWADMCKDDGKSGMLQLYFYVGFYIFIITLL